MSEDPSHQHVIRDKPPSGWGKLFFGLLVGAVAGAAALYVTKVDPSLIAGMTAQPAPAVDAPQVVEAAANTPPPHQGLPLTPFEMGSLQPDEAVESIKITLGVGADGAALREAVDVHLGLGFPLRLHPLGGLERDPSFAAFPRVSSLEGMATAIEPGQMASFEFSAKEDDIGGDELRTSRQLLAGVKAGDLHSIGFASQGRTDWVLAGYRIEVNGKLFAANGLVNARAQEKLAASRESLMKMLPDYEEKVNKEKLTAAEEAELKGEHALVRALSGRMAGAAPWYEESDEKFQAAPIGGTQVRKLTVTLTSGVGDRPGTRNPLYFQAGGRKYLLSSESDPLLDETDPQIFELAGFELAMNPLTKEALARPGVGVIGSGGPGGKVPDRAQLDRVLVEADDETVYDSAAQAEDKKALPSFWLTPVAHYDETGGLVTPPLAQGEVPLWTAGMKSVIPAAGIVPEPPPPLVVGPPKTLPPLLPPQRRTAGGGLPVRGPRGILPFLNALANLLSPLIAPQVPTISAVRVAPPTGIIRAGERVTVTWSVNGNVSQINTWRVQLFGVLPHKPGAQAVVLTPLATEFALAPPGTGNRAWPMVQPISVAPILPGDLPYAYVMPVVTAMNVGGVGGPFIVASATGSLLPLFPAGSTVATVGLSRGAASPPNPGAGPGQDRPAASFQVTRPQLLPGPTDTPWLTMLSAAPPAASTAWFLNTVSASHYGFNFDTHETSPVPLVTRLAAINTATRPAPGPNPANAEIIRLRYEGLVSLPAGFNTLRAVAHVGFVGGSDAAASCTVTARAEIGGGALTPDPQFLQSGNLNLGPQPFFTIEPNAPLPTLVRGPPTNRSPMVLVDMPMRLTQLRTNSSLGTYALDPLNPGAYTLSVTVPGAPPAPADVTTQPALTALNAGLLNALMAVPAGQVYVTLSFYITLQSTDPATSVGVFGVRLVPE